MRNIILILFLIGSTAFAQEKVLNYQGVLLDSEGQPVADDTYSAVFELYDVETGGTALWSDTDASITTVNGAFAARLGSGASNISATVDFSNTLWLRVLLDGSSFNSRIRIDPEPTALSIATALRAELDALKAEMESLVANRGTVVPIGTIVPFGGDTLDIPEGWLLCSGKEIDRVENAALFEVIDEYWGEGNGSSTFNLPDLRGYFLRGVDAGKNSDPDAANRIANKIGGNTGDKVGSYQGDEFKEHDHDFSLPAAHNDNGDGEGYMLINVAQGALVIGKKTNIRGTSPETRPKNAYVNYIIKAK